MVESGVWAIFGPQTPSVSWMVRSIASNLHIPHLQVNWDYRSVRRHRHHPSNMTVNLHPEPSALSQAFMDLVESRKWKSFTLIYEQAEGLIKLKDLLRVPAIRDADNGDSTVKMAVRQHKPDRQSYKKLFKDITKRAETNIVLSIPVDKVHETLRQAQEVGMMTDYHNYLIANLDIHTLDLQDFQYSHTNISGLTMLDPKGQEMGYFAREWIYGRTHSSSKKSLNTETALLFDAVSLFARALDDLDRTQQVNGPKVTCDSRIPWAFGAPLMNFMKMVNVKGLTGNIKFDEYGQRSDFILDILELKKAGFQKAGTWNFRSKVNITRNFTEASYDYREALRNKTLRVTIPTNADPYVSLKENADRLTGNDRFEGYCVDLLEKISNILGFRFELYPVANNAYGTPKNGQWNGMIRELLDRKADLAIADLTITSERQTAVDFTLPFMNLGISILYRKPEEKPPKLFSFLSPFSVEVWLYMATSFLGVSLLLYVISRLSPYEWVSSHPCDDDPDELENQFSLGNCLWFALGSIMQQGSDLSPRALSTRTLASIWWFFTLIMVSSYTANLAAFLTVSRMASPIENADDLAKQTTITYGCKGEGSTYFFFKGSNHTTYERMWSTMESLRPSVFVTDNTKGIDRVLKGNYAYLMESTTIEYEVQKNCDLQQIGSLLDQKGYGIATPPDSPYRGFLSEAILTLQEEGQLAELKKKWWVTRLEEKGESCPPDKKSSSAAAELDIANVGGVFVVLLAGTGVGCLIVVIEFIWKTKKVARHERQYALVMLWRELVLICSGEGGTRNPGTSSSTSSNANLNAEAASGSSSSPSSKRSSKSQETTDRNNAANEEAAASGPGKGKLTVQLPPPDKSGRDWPEPDKWRRPSAQ
ncbi:Glutamate receptor ionotropic, kainate 2 [Halotydeus destructor]|nr:Glutamate receptor ionotropic, kainate 2 [Halotydeus destructor]